MIMIITMEDGIMTASGYGTKKGEFVVEETTRKVNNGDGGTLRGCRR